MITRQDKGGGTQGKLLRAVCSEHTANPPSSLPLHVAARSPTITIISTITITSTITSITATITITVTATITSTIRPSMPARSLMPLAPPLL